MELTFLFVGWLLRWLVGNFCVFVSMVGGDFISRFWAKTIETPARKILLGFRFFHFPLLLARNKNCLFGKPFPAVLLMWFSK